MAGWGFLGRSWSEPGLTVAGLAGAGAVIDWASAGPGPTAGAQYSGAKPGRSGRAGQRSRPRY